MAELEIHHEGHEADDTGRMIGVLAGVLAVVLAIVTILSHRAHTDAVLLKTDANDQWSYYQAKRLKLHNVQLGQDLLAALGGGSPAAAKTLAAYGVEKKRYERESKDTQREAEAKENECKHVEARALRFDYGEGLLEIGLVLTSLYFVSRKKLFPLIGVFSGALGAIIAATAWLV